MKNLNVLLFSLFLSVVLVGCTNKEPKNYAYKIMFIEQEQFVEPYPTRVIITPEFVRFDDGEGSQDFVLFDRKNKVVRSVVTGEQSIMSVHPKNEVIESPLELKMTEKDLGVLKDAPKVDGKAPKHYQLLVNNKVCSDVIAVKGLLPAAVKALAEFAELMASDSKKTLPSMPADTHEACNLAQDTFAPTRQLKYGFPIQTSGDREYARTLVDYDANYKLDKKLFELPKGYNEYTVQELREGKVKFEKSI